MFSVFLFVASVSLLCDHVESQIPTIKVEISDQVPRVGDNVTFTCIVTGLDASTVTLNKAIVQNEGQIVTEQIAINDALSRLYATFKRFSITKTTDGVNQLFTLRIAGVQLEDSGNYGCAVPTLDDLYALTTLDVYRKPTNISFVHVNQSIVVVRENERPNFVCEVPNVLPIPSVRIWLEREVVSPKDITNDFLVASRQNVMCNQNPSEKSCPLHISYTLFATNRDFNVSFNHNGKKMTCKATMRVLEKDEISTDITLKVIYAPKILCAGIWNTTLNYTNLEIRCRVHASPPAESANKSVTIKEKEMGRFVVVKPGENTDKYSLYDNVMPSTDGQVTDMVFIIKTVTEEHFTYDYTFLAVNEEGQTTKTLRIEKSLTPVSDGADECLRGAQLLPILLFTLFANIFGRL